MRKAAIAGKKGRRAGCALPMRNPKTEKPGRKDRVSQN